MIDKYNLSNERDARNSIALAYNEFRITRGSNKREAIFNIARETGYSNEHVRGILDSAAKDGVYLRSNRVSSEEAENILELRRMGKSAGYISKMLGRSRSTIYKYLKPELSNDRELVLSYPRNSIYGIRSENEQKREAGKVRKGLLAGVVGTLVVVGAGVGFWLGASYIHKFMDATRENIGKINASIAKMNKNYEIKIAGLEGKIDEQNQKISDLESAISPGITSTITLLGDDVIGISDTMGTIINYVENLGKEVGGIKNAPKITPPVVKQAPPKVRVPEPPKVSEEDSVKRFYELYAKIEGAGSSIGEFYKSRITNADSDYEKNRWAEAGISALEMTIDETGEIRVAGERQ